MMGWDGMGLGCCRCGERAGGESMSNEPFGGPMERELTSSYAN